MREPVAMARNAIPLDGGSTEVIRPSDGSPLIDTGNPAPPGSGGGACEAHDQRGMHAVLTVRRGR